jgi:hypothetical protein
VAVPLKKERKSKQSASDPWNHDSGGAARWSELLAEPDDEARLPRFRCATYAGNPLGTDEFVERVNSGQPLPEDLLDGTSASPQWSPPDTSANVATST